jgi:thiol-disulfide isomerase/thioredoxin
MPALEAAYQQHGEAVSFLAVSVQEDKLTVSRFARQFELSLPVLLDTDGAAMNLYGVRGLPTTLFVNAQGVVVAQHLGGLTEESLAEYLDELLASEE